jgi:putative transposase
MPWKEQDVVSLRLEFVLKALSEATPFESLCRQYGVSPKTGYKWKRRFLERGQAGLHDLSRRPERSPSELPEAVVCAMVRIKQAHRDWGPRKIRGVYSRQHPASPLPSESSFKRVLERCGLTHKRRRRPSQDSGRLQTRAPAQACNDVWTVDFKGSWHTVDRERCEPLTVRDEFSRFILYAQPVAHADTQTVRQVFERLFETYGLPRTIRSDNGPPFASVRAPLGLTRLSAWWLALGIDLDRIDPGKPYQNGGHERMHRDIAVELERRIPGNLTQQAAALETWRQSFNQERPHEALAMKCPAEVYQKSPKRFSSTPESLVYPETWLQRRVCRTGSIRLGGRPIQITTALAGWNIGLEPLGSGAYGVHFGRLPLGKLDRTVEAFVPLTRATEPPSEHEEEAA